MNDKDKISTTIMIASAILSVGILASTVIISQTQKTLRLYDRVVTVKGLVERDVTANIATWQVETNATSNNLVEAQTNIDKNLATIQNFLLQKGFKPEEIELSPMKVIDRQANEYYGQSNNDQTRYIIKTSLGLRSENIDLVQIVSNQTSELVKAGITISPGNCPGPSFTYTKLNEIKPEMLIEATKNARISGDQFANDSGSKLGKIKRASQGVFSITERDKSSSDQENQADYCNSSPNKKIRVVTTIDYYLE